MKDLTCIYYTANIIPDKFANNVREQLLTAIGDTPLISLSKKPLDFGTNIVDEDPKRSITNVYKALVAGAKVATTDYIAFCEDDTLYAEDHFYTYRPPLDTFAYNFARWNIHTWSDPPFFSLRQRPILATCIAPRKLFIEAIEERFAKHPNPPEEWMGEPGRNQHEKKLRVTRHKTETFETYSPVIVFSHPKSFGYQSTGTKKRSGKIRALELHYWGTAKQVRDKYE